MTPLAYLKWGGIALFFCSYTITCYHQGGLASKSKYEALQATQAGALAKAYEDQQLAAQAKQVAYEHEIDQLKTDALTYPTVAVRLCPNHPAVPQAPSGGQVVSAPGRILPPVSVQDSAGPDVGPALFSLADYADEIVAKCR